MDDDWVVLREGDLRDEKKDMEQATELANLLNKALGIPREKEIIPRLLLRKWQEKYPRNQVSMNEIIGVLKVLKVSNPHMAGQQANYTLVEIEYPPDLFTVFELNHAKKTVKKSGKKTVKKSGKKTVKKSGKKTVKKSGKKGKK